MRLSLSYANALAPGDIRELGRGDWVTLADDVRERANWLGIHHALGTALRRGASIVWKDGGVWNVTD